MKRVNHKVRTLHVGFLMLFSSAVLAETGAVGSVEVEGGELYIAPSVPYAELQVTVVGDGVYWQQRFVPGERASVSLSEIGVVSDGSYGFEVVAVPEVDKNAWEAAGGDEAAELLLEAKEAARTYLQQGGFQIASGQVVSRASQEESGDALQPQQPHQ